MARQPTLITDTLASSHPKLESQFDELYEDLGTARPPSAHTHPASAISDSTATGRSVLTAATAAAARTTLGLGDVATRNVGTSAGQVRDAVDVAYTNARTPTAHTHVVADVSDSTATGRSLVASASASAARTTLGLGAAATLAVGTTAGTVAAGDDSRITGATPTTRTLTAGAGLNGGGTLAADRTFAVSYGTVAGTACVGNDGRLSDARAPTAHSAALITSGTLDRARLPALTDADVPSDVVEVTATTRTLALSDRGIYLRWTASGAKTCTVDTTAGGSGGEYHLRNAASSGDLSISASGVTIHAPAGGRLVLAPGMTCTLKRVGANVFDLFGQTTT